MTGVPRIFEEAFPNARGFAYGSLPETNTPHGHFAIRCSCGVTMSQCRCMAAKAEVVRPHPACGGSLNYER